MSPFCTWPPVIQWHYFFHKNQPWTLKSLPWWSSCFCLHWLPGLLSVTPWHYIESLELFIESYRITSCRFRVLDSLFEHECWCQDWTAVAERSGRICLAVICPLFFPPENPMCLHLQWLLENILSSSEAHGQAFYDPLCNIFVALPELYLHTPVFCSPSWLSLSLTAHMCRRRSPGQHACVGLASFWPLLHVFAHKPCVDCRLCPASFLAF